MVTVEKKQVTDFEHFSITHPHPIRPPFWGMRVRIFVRLSASFCILLADLHPPAVPSAPSGRYKPKRHRQSSDYQCLFLFLGSNFPFSSGAGGSRTPVQTCCKDAFYTFSLRLLVGAWQVRDQPTPRLSSELRLRIEACARYPSFYDTSDRTPGGGGFRGSIQCLGPCPGSGIRRD